MESEPVPVSTGKTVPPPQPETAAERVTAEAPPEPLTTAKSAAQKDPRKVAAGRAGAAARKAKQQKLLDELREAKAALEPATPPVDVVPPERSAQAPPKDAAVPAVATTRQQQTAARTDWIPWIIGGLGLAGVVWFLRGNGFAITTRGVAAPPKASAPSPAGTAAKQPVASKQLETSSSPFYME